MSESASRLHCAHSNHVTEARSGSWGPGGPGTGGTDRDFFLFHQLLQGEPPVLLPSHHYGGTLTTTQTQSKIYLFAAQHNTPYADSPLPT